MRLVNSVIGTAGHIDHGKTMLVKALTGEDCDRLEEEKRRGITIDIGFAAFTLGNGETAGIVDAPGHLSFIHNMLAGASGIDIAMLVVAADDGVMPQTVEHLAILSLLEVHGLVVALTKCDLVDDETLELAKNDVAELLKNSPFLKAKVIPCSSVTNEGVTTLKGELEKLLGESKKEENDQRYFRMPVDRVFTIKGHGAVVTGTARCGSVKVGDTVTLLPGGGEARLRQIENHGNGVDVATKGSRTALNLAGRKKESVRRGSVVCHSAVAHDFKSFIGNVICHQSSPHDISHAKAYLLHVHTEQLLCRVYLESAMALKAGEQCFAQIRFEEPIQLNHGDRFVLRSSSAKYTLGGGMVVFPGGPLLGRRGIVRGKTKWSALLRGEADGAMAIVMEQPWGVKVDEIVSLFNLRRAGVNALLKKMDGAGKFEYQGNEYLYVIDEGRRIVDNIGADIALFHKENSSLIGIEESRLTKSYALKEMEEKIARYWIGRIISSGKAMYNGSFIQLPEHRVRLTEEDEAIKKKIMGAFKDGGLTPPKLATLHRELTLPKNAVVTIVRSLIASGDLISITPDYALHKDAFNEAKARLIKEMERSGSVDTGTYRDLLGIGRKAAIEILEYFDKTGVTKRVDNKGTRKSGRIGE